MPKKQKSGLYRTKVKIGVDANGKPINKYVSGKTKVELENNKRKVIAFYILGTGLSEDRLFGEYAQEWYRVRKEPFISQSSKDGYRTMLNKYILPAFGNRHLRAIQPVELQAFLNGFEGYSKSTITNALVVLRGIYAAAKQDRIVQDDPTANLAKPSAKPPKERRALTDDERERMRGLFATHPDGLYLAVMYYTGMRPGEVRGLKWGDFDWAEGLIHVQRDIDYAGGKAAVGALKTKAADRYIPIADELKALLEPVKGAGEAFVFHGRDNAPIAQATAVRKWIRLMADCGLAEPIPPVEQTAYSKKDIRGQYRVMITPHTMRHNFITMCWESGMDIMLTMKIVGHSDYETTRNIYTHLSRKHLDNAKNQMNDMFKGKA